MPRLTCFRLLAVLPVLACSGELGDDRALALLAGELSSATPAALSVRIGDAGEPCGWSTDAPAYRTLGELGVIELDSLAGGRVRVALTPVGATIAARAESANGVAATKLGDCESAPLSVTLAVPRVATDGAVRSWGDVAEIDYRVDWIPTAVANTALASDPTLASANGTVEPEDAGTSGARFAPETGRLTACFRRGTDGWHVERLDSRRPRHGVRSGVPLHGVEWTHLSSAAGDIENLDEAPEATAALVFDVDLDGRKDVVIGSRTAAPAVVWYRREACGWSRRILEAEQLPVEAGGAVHDIDGDGDLDLVFGADFDGTDIWWWENPYPRLVGDVQWARHLVKIGGTEKHHDQIFGDFDGDGRAELVSWNQVSKQLLLFEIPDDPRGATGWPARTIYTWTGAPDLEGLASADIDGDGTLDIVGGGRWFRHVGDGEYRAHVIDDGFRFSRAATGQLVEGGAPEVVFSPGDADGPVRWFELVNGAWIGHDLLEGGVVHGHSLQTGDVDGDGHLDVFLAEMGQWSLRPAPPDNPGARAWIFYGDGTGGFDTQLVSAGQGLHESKLADLDGDGRLDILGKPFLHNAPRLDLFLNRPAASAVAPLALDRWHRRVIDADRPWRSIFVDAADLDDDGREDIVTGGWWYRNPGTAGTEWTRHTIGESLRNMAAVGDFDGDGLPDILGTGGKGSDDDDRLVWARNAGGGSFVTLSNVPRASGDFLQGVAVGRFGDRDRIALSWHGAGRGVQMLSVPADAAGEAWGWRTISADSQDEQLSAGDIDGDGDSDLLLGTRWLRSDDGVWTTQVVTTAPGAPDRNRLADVDGDGRLDAVVAYEAVNSPGRVAWYARADSGERWTEHAIGTLIGPMSLDVADMDGDGDADIVVGEHNYADASSARLLVFENAAGDGLHWRVHLIHAGDEHHDGARVVDIDGDGDLDILSIGWSHPRVLLYENQAR